MKRHIDSKVYGGEIAVVYHSKKFIHFQPQHLLIESLLTFRLNAAAFFRTNLLVSVVN